MKAWIALEDGTIFEGVSFTGSGETSGEVVFNTAMSGYQELLSDPSYRGQIVTMTYPLIGNYGVNDEDMESARVQVEALIVREYCPFPSNFRARGTLAELLRKYGVLGIEGVDTRALTRHLRQAGAMRGIISTKDHDQASLVARARQVPSLLGRDLAREVSCLEPYGWTSAGAVDGTNFTSADPGRHRVVAIDYGIKRNQLRLLSERGCRVQVVPASTPAAAILAMHPDGIFLSNGPGDPAGIKGAAETIRALLGRKPIFGVCLGNQLLGLACGGRTYKLKFGHRGNNQPVKDLSTGKVTITVQNHGFCLDQDSLDPKEIELTHINLNDNSVEGISHRRFPAFAVQYHPEHAPGPHDAVYLFDRFVQMMTEQGS